MSCSLIHTHRSGLPRDQNADDASYIALTDPLAPVQRRETSARRAQFAGAIAQIVSLGNAAIVQRPDAPAMPDD